MNPESNGLEELEGKELINELEMRQIDLITENSGLKQDLQEKELRIKELQSFKKFIDCGDFGFYLEPLDDGSYKIRNGSNIYSGTICDVSNIHEWEWTLLSEPLSTEQLYEIICKLQEINDMSEGVASPMGPIHILYNLTVNKGLDMI